MRFFPDGKACCAIPTHMSDGSEPEAPPRPCWRESLVEFISTRLELVALESRDAGRIAARRLLVLAFIAGCAMTAWLAGIAGLIGWLASAGGGLPWYLAALAASALHLLLAGLAVVTLRRPAPPAFPHVRAELSKDREWLLNLKNKPRA
jgi:uncharacterized membrane protein YqjE